MVAGVVREVREEQRQQTNGGTKGLEAALLYYSNSLIECNQSTRRRRRRFGDSREVAVGVGGLRSSGFM